MTKLGKLALAMALMLGSAQAMANDRLFELRSGAWEGGAYGDETTHAFSHCAISAVYLNGVTLYFWLDASYSLTMGLNNPSWRTVPEDRYQARLSIDGRDLGLYEFIADRDGLVLAEIGSDGFVFDRLRRGRGLTIHAARRRLDFGLAGTFDALSRLVDCVDAGTRTAGIADNPFAGPGNPFGGAPGPAGDFSEDERRKMSALLRWAGLEDFEFVDPEEMKDYPYDHIAWQTADFLGVLLSVPMGQDETQPEFLMSILSGFGGDCDGDFATGVREPEAAGDYVLREAFGACSGDDGLAVYMLGIFGGDENARIIVHVTDKAGRDSAAAALTSLKAAISGTAARQES